MDSSERELPGGVASEVRIIDSPQGPVVLKRALGKLKVAADWFSDPARSSIEVAALRAASELLGAHAVPRVLQVDEASNSFTMNLIEQRFRNWKLELLAGNLDPRTATAVGSLLGSWHRMSTGRADLEAKFKDTTFFDELRLEPFFRKVANRRPEISSHIHSVIEGMARRKQALVHGDFSPKNLLVDSAEVVLLDFEVAHWGDPRFDVAFLLTHLLLKAMRRGVNKASIDALSMQFLGAYRENGLPVLDAELARILACLVLARIDGDSPVDYLVDLDPPAVRCLAERILLSPPADPRLLFTTAASSR